MTECSSHSQSPQPTFKAVILAAGRGQRLREESVDGLKPLTPLLGQTLLERAVLSCRSAGVSECIVVVGYRQEKLIPHIDALADRYTLRLRAVENPAWQAGNGTSALAARPYLEEPFLLMMCDHVVDPTILQCLRQAADAAEGCLLAVDRDQEHIFDLEDATKVRLSGGTITAIGKELTTFDGIDTGCFFCRASVFAALVEAQASGDSSLTAGMRQLIARRQLQAVDIGKRFWSDIDTPESLAYTERVLMAKRKRN